MPAPSSPIHILCSTDDRFAPWCGVMLTSLLHNLAGREAVVHIVDAGLCERHRGRLRSLEHRYPCRVEYVTPAQSLLARLPEGVNGWPPASFLRLAVAELLPELERVIYIDCDIAVDTSVAPLWETDLRGKACGAVIDGPNPATDGSRRHEKVGALGMRGHYFNSGVLLIDIAAFRNLDILGRSITLLSQADATFDCPDQDVLNILLDGEYLPLPTRWNVRTSLYDAHWHEPDDDEEATARGVMRGHLRGIIHYSTHHKPWLNDIRDFHPLEHVWRRYKKMSPYSDEPLTPQKLPLRTRLARWRHALMFRHRLPSAYTSRWKRY